METSDMRLWKLHDFLEAYRKMLAESYKQLGMVPVNQMTQILILSPNENKFIWPIPTVVWPPVSREEIKQAIKNKFVKLPNQDRTFALLHTLQEQESSEGESTDADGDIIVIVETRQGNQAWRFHAGKWTDDKKHVAGLGIFQVLLQ